MKRDYGIDLLKVVAMLMVVMLHIMGRGGVNEACAVNTHSVRYLVEQIWYAFCVPAVDCFVLATGYIMSRHVFKYSRIVKLWGQVVFYSFCMTAIAAVFCPWVPITWRDWINVVFPVATNQYWFVTMYVALFFTMPFLNHLLRTLSERDLNTMLATGFVLFSLYPAFAGADLFVLHGGYSYLWFVYLYLVAGYIAGRRERFDVKRPVLGVGVVALPVLSLFLQVIDSQFNKRFGISFGSWGGYSSPEVFALAVVLLLLFSSMRISAVWLRNVVGFVAPGVFSVYVLHSNSIFRKMVCWNGRFAPLADLNILGMLAGIFGSAVAILISGIFIDWFRRRMFATLERQFKMRFTK